MHPTRRIPSETPKLRPTRDRTASHRRLPTRPSTRRKPPSRRGRPCAGRASTLRIATLPARSVSPSRAAVATAGRTAAARTARTATSAQRSPTKPGRVSASPTIFCARTRAMAWSVEAASSATLRSMGAAYRRVPTARTVTSTSNAGPAIGAFGCRPMSFRASVSRGATTMLPVRSGASARRFSWVRSRCSSASPTR
jgi:hypothetical protein